MKYYVNTLSLFKVEKSSVCSIVKIHSLYKDPNGTVLHQEGVGWVVATPRYLGVVTPFHVVTQADIVVAECTGRFFHLTKPAVDAERDLAVFKIDADFDEIFDKVVNPLLLAVPRDNDFFLKIAKNSPTAANGLKRQWVYEVHQESYRNYLEAIMLTMTNFNIVIPAEKAQDQSPMLASPIGYGHVQGFAIQDQSYIQNLIRLTNFGIKPGLSGAPLIGVPYTAENYADGQYRLAVELTPRVVLGMATKTRLNGAETLAISITDIIDFLEEFGSSKLKTFPEGRSLEVRYQPIVGLSQAQLQSYIQLTSPQGGAAQVTEYCSSEYLNSASATPTKSRKLEAALREREFTQSDKNLLSSGNPNKVAPRRTVPTQKEVMKSGGGEYGEGGDAFLTPLSQFLTSHTKIGTFDKEWLSTWDWVAQASSFGLYISPTDCKSRGLRVGNKLIHGVQMPNGQTVRLLTFEDLRRLHKIHNEKTLGLLLKYGMQSREPFMKSELKGVSLAIPMTHLQSMTSDDKNWQPGGKLYFKQLIQPTRRDENVGLKTTLNPFGLNWDVETPWKPGDILQRQERTQRQEQAAGLLEISDKHFSLKTDLTLPAELSDARFENYFSIRHSAGLWTASLAVGRSCRIEMAPKYFTQVNPWNLHYNDGKTKLSVDFMNQDRFMLVNIQKIACPELKNLALGEIEVYLSGDYVQVGGGSRASALVHDKIDWSKLSQKFSTQKGGSR